MGRRAFFTHAAVAAMPCMCIRLLWLVLALSITVWRCTVPRSATLQGQRPGCAWQRATAPATGRSATAGASIDVHLSSSAMGRIPAKSRRPRMNAANRLQEAGGTNVWRPSSVVVDKAAACSSGSSLAPWAYESARGTAKQINWAAV
jgi:hypothetical protein